MLNQISEQQSNKVVAINENFEAVLPASLFGIDRSLSIGLLFAFYGGVIWNGSAFDTIADGTIALTGSATNYIEADSAGVVYQNTSGFTAGRTPLYVLVTSSTGITTATDYRIANPAYAGGIGNFRQVTIGSGTITASAPALQITQTWNNAAVAFVGADMNITDTASDAASILQRWRVNGSAVATLFKTGAMLLAGALSLPAGAVGAPAIMLGGDTTTGIYRTGSNQLGVAVSGSNVGTWSSTGLQVIGLNNTGNTTLGDSSGDTLTINAGTWTIGSNYTATRAAGTVAAGTNNLLSNNYSGTGYAGGTSSINARLDTLTTQGANAIASAATIRPSLIHSGSATLANGYASIATVTINSSGNLSNPTGYLALFNLTSTGTAGTNIAYSVESPTITGAGTVGVFEGLRVANIGHANIASAYGIRILDFTLSTTMRGIFSEISAGTGKHNLYINGTAPNYFAGAVGVGTTSSLDSINFRVARPLTGSTAPIAFWQNGIVQSDATSTSTGIRNDLGTAAASFTLPHYYYFVANQSTIGAGSAVSNQYGFIALSSMTGAANNYGFRGDIPAATGRWNVHMNGTAQNFFAGNVGIGAGMSVPTNALCVAGVADTAVSQIIATSSGDVLQLVPAAAGNGARMRAVNNAQTDFEPLSLVGETVQIYGRTGAGTSEIVAIFSAVASNARNVTITGATVSGNPAIGVSAGRLHLAGGQINVTGIPTSAAGLSAGDVWSDAGVLTVV